MELSFEQHNEILFRAAFAHTPYLVILSLQFIAMALLLSSLCQNSRNAKIKMLRKTILFLMICSAIILYNRQFPQVSDRQLGETMASGEEALRKKQRPRPWPTIGPQCPIAAQKNVGLFDASSNSSAKDKFHDVLLLVACNYAYYDMLQNWEYLANQLKIKWAVLALDEELYNFLGPERAISPGELFSVSGPQSFRQGEFSKLSCNKMRQVMSIAETCGMDIVFSDVDNIFYQNPFEHDFGRLIESGRYDYIYQSNLEPSQYRPLADECLKGNPRKEANTGFYFVSRKSVVMKTVVNATLERCFQPGNKIDDQTLFWEEFWKVNKTSFEANKVFHHCNVPEYVEPSSHNLQASKDAAFSFCCLDPFLYPVGRGRRIKNPVNPVTYHANFAWNKANKINKLRMSRWDKYGWDESRIDSYIS